MRMYSQKTKYYTSILPVVALQMQQRELYSSLYVCWLWASNVFISPNVNEMFYSKIILHLICHQCTHFNLSTTTTTYPRASHAQACSARWPRPWFLAYLVESFVVAGRGGTRLPACVVWGPHTQKVVFFSEISKLAHQNFLKFGMRLPIGEKIRSVGGDLFG